MVPEFKGSEKIGIQEQTSKQQLLNSPGEEKESQYYFVYGILSGSQSKYDMENVTEILTAKEKCLSLS